MAHDWCWSYYNRGNQKLSFSTLILSGFKRLTLYNKYPSYFINTSQNQNAVIISIELLLIPKYTSTYFCASPPRTSLNTSLTAVRILGVFVFQKKVPHHHTRFRKSQREAATFLHELLTRLLSLLLRDFSQPLQQGRQPKFSLMCTLFRLSIHHLLSCCTSYHWSYTAKLLIPMVLQISSLHH